jgi:Luciferase
MKDAQVKIHNAVSQWDGVTVHPHRFGGTEFRLGKRELGHVHGNSLVDIPFPMNVRNELVESGRVEPHHILPQSGWISFYMRSESDILEAINFFRLSYEIATRQIARRVAEKTEQSNSMNAHHDELEEKQI